VYPLQEQWIVYRDADSQDRSGWMDGAAQIIDTPEFKGDALKIWGADAIRSAAKGDLGGLERPRDWYGVKVNLHLHRQINYAPGLLAFFGDDDDEE